MTTSRERDDAMLERVAEELRRPAELDPWLDQRIMRAVREAPPMPWWERAAAWFRDPIPLQLSPMTMTFAVAAAAVVVAVGLRVNTGPTGNDLPVAIEETPAMNIPVGTRAGLHSVQFVLVLPSAESVAVVGDFNDWQADATPLRRVGDGGMWTIEVTLPPGHHHYAFIVDGEVWMPDPSAPLTTDDDFGKPNSVVVVEGAA